VSDMNWLLNLTYKYPGVELEFHNAPALLQHVVLTFVQLSVEMYGINPIMTRVLDPISGESGVHNQYRGADIRNQYMKTFMYTKEQSSTLVNLINQKFKRIDGFKTVLMHSFKSNPAHYHFQIPHENVKMKGPLYVSN